MSESFYNSYDDLLFLMKNSGKSYDEQLVDKAYRFALEAHGNQLRKSGEPYIVHPISVACILVELGMDVDSVVAAILHDVVEDTPVTLSQVSEMFSPGIASIIDGLTKISKMSFSTREERQAENIRKMLIAMYEDIRVIIIKLADRLNNMRTIDALAPQKRRDIALETMEIYAPIAHRLGIRSVKEELEDLSLRQLDSVAYKEIVAELAERKLDKENFISTIKAQITETLSKENVAHFTVEGRIKSINGIYNKMYKQNKTLDEIYDVYAVRVLVDTMDDCYHVLGIIHQMFIPIPNRFKDYITMPKPNGYQSLHTTVISRDTHFVFEIQIRTFEMHKMAEYGIAAHWKYKLGMSAKGESNQRLDWIRDLLDKQRESGDVTEILRQIKSDMMPEEVYAFTPKGDLKVVPAGATVIDFAYAIHSAVGNRMIGAKINGNIVPINQVLATGDIVEILTTKDATRGPSRDWLNIVKTSEARTKIRAWFKKERREENIIEGKNSLAREIRRGKYHISEEDSKDILLEISQRLAYDTLDDFYAAIGYGGLQITRIMQKFHDEAQKRYAAREAAAEPAEITGKTVSTKNSGAKDGVVVSGLNNVLVKYARCCNPLPGDEIIGFITRGFGVSIHKRDCTNVPADISSSAEPERWVEAVWAGENTNREFDVSIDILGDDRGGLLNDITSQFVNMHLGINSLNSRVIKNNKAQITIEFTTKGIEHMEMVISRLLKIKGITSIKRSNR
ncbi:MAG: bifunctional (p)ppGpp synthetase/guanosine-3',5'-bis(diphosphate) 3'-pyrophosphohydrolase [Clostridia bacterium]|nr:bifunctional (p)ppGpp synthetase/guanosine-3',5'-bis(diphosphate) 3'-pyrophosphohydrolase [Clostridia bacterium]